MLLFFFFLIIIICLIIALDQAELQILRGTRRNVQALSHQFRYASLFKNSLTLYSGRHASIERIGEYVLVFWLTDSCV